MSLEQVELICGDCLQKMDELIEQGVEVDAIITDPPYYKVKNESWDRQWNTPSQFLFFIRDLCNRWYDLLKPNGSLYCFASPQMAARVECIIRKRFNVLNRIRWVKNDGWHKIAKKKDLRSYLSNYEAIIFAEHYGADNIAKGKIGYRAKSDKLRGFIFEPLRAYLAGEWKRAGLKQKDANAACGTAGMARHYFNRSQWCLPTAKH